MLADPQSITIATVATSFPKTDTLVDSNVYTTSDGAWTFYVTHRKSGSRDRKTISLTQTKIAADPLTAVNQRVNASVALTVNAPLSGFSVADLTSITVALADYLKASTNANLIKILGGEK